MRLITGTFLCITIWFVTTTESFPHNGNGLEDSLEADLFFGNSSVCESSVCQTVGKVLKANLNTSVDPCDDFYEFACGGWIATHELEEDPDYRATMTDLSEIVIRQINESLHQAPKPNESKAVIFAKDLFKSCLAQVGSKKIDYEPFKKAMSSFGGWPIVTGTFNESEYDWKDAYSTLVTMFNYQPVINMELKGFFVAKVLKFEIADLGTFSRETLTEQNDAPYFYDAYKSEILETALLLGAQNNSETMKQVDDILAFETIIAKFEHNYNTSQYSRITLKEMNQLSDNRVDWNHVINQIYTKMNSSIRVPMDEPVIVEDLEYFTEIPKLMEMIPKRVIANYFGWIVTKKFIGGVNSDFNLGNNYNKIENTQEVLDNFYETYQAPKVEAWQICGGLIDKNLGQGGMDHALDRLFLENTFTTKDKEEGTILVNEIRDTFSDLLEDNKWLDSSTKERAFNKLKEMVVNVGYPDWIMDNNKLDSYYNLVGFENRDVQEANKAFMGVIKDQD